MRAQAGPTRATADSAGKVRWGAGVGSWSFGLRDSQQSEVDSSQSANLLLWEAGYMEAVKNYNHFYQGWWW